MTYICGVYWRGEWIGWKDFPEKTTIDAATYQPDPLGVGHDLPLWKARNGVRQTIGKEPVQMAVKGSVWNAMEKRP